MTEFGLTPKQAAILTASLDRHLMQGTVIVYGSRAKGAFAAHSDIDLVLQGAGTINRHLLANIQDEIDESDFPFLCDIQYLEEIHNPSLIEHIRRVGKVFYTKSAFSEPLSC